MLRSPFVLILLKNCAVRLSLVPTLVPVTIQESCLHGFHIMHRFLDYKSVHYKNFCDLTIQILLY